jgi:hypothetical protein
MNAIQIRALTKSFTSAVAVNHLSLGIMMLTLVIR